MGKSITMTLSTLYITFFDLLKIKVSNAL